jgi:hypothetical protein
MNLDTGFCPDQEPERIEWVRDSGNETDWWDRKKAFKQCLAEMWPNQQTGAKSGRVAAETVEEKFLRLADEWSRATSHISSVTDLINDYRYQQIIALNWPVVPYLLNDLDRNKRFWFPALAAITGLRPFDRHDASNYRRMTDAWLRWGKRKGLI